MLTEKRLKRIKNVTSKRHSGLVVVLEDIHDPHNAEAVFRTCDAFGIQDVYLIFRQEKYFNPRRVGRATSSSANKWLDFHIFRSTSECLRQLRKLKYEIVATVLDDGAKSMFTAKLTGRKVALMFGNEHRGLTEEAVKLSQKKIMIPMSGMVQSLNLSVTAAILIYEVARQRQGKRQYFLKPAEQKKLARKFSRL